MAEQERGALDPSSTVHACSLLGVAIGNGAADVYGDSVQSGRLALLVWAAN